MLYVSVVYPRMSISRLAIILSIPVLIFSFSACRTKSKSTATGVFEQAHFDEDDFADALEDLYETRLF